MRIILFQEFADIILDSIVSKYDLMFLSKLPLIISLDYIGVDESGMVTLHMVFRGNYPRLFNIHIEQIDCGSKKTGKECS